MTNWKTTASGILAFLIATLTTLTAFEIPKALMTPNADTKWLWITVACNFAVSLCRVWIGLIQTDAVAPAGKVSAAAAGFSKLGLLFAMALVSLGLITVACTPSALHQAAEVANGNAVTLANIETMNEQAYTAGLISTADSKLVSQYTLQVVQLNEQFIAQIRTAKTLNASSAQSILTAIDGYAASLDTLAQQGVLHIKDANTQKTFASYVALLRASVATAKQIVAATAGTAPAAMLIPYPRYLTLARAA